MIRLIIFFIIFTLILTLTSRSNPVKIRWILTILTRLYFRILSIRTKRTWIPIMLSIIFLGGIILTYTIISSLYPPVRSNKSNLSWTNLIIMSLIPAWFYRINNQINLIKWTAHLNFNIELLVIFITLYFIMFIYILSYKLTRLRISQCQKK